MANSFNAQYSSVVKHKSSKTARTTTKKLKRIVDTPPPITPADTAKAIKSSKASKALGPDQLSPLHLKHLGEKGVIFLTHLFNLSLSNSKIPAIWKTSTIVPLLKPGKPAQESSSFRPVSLLCPAIKVLERVLLPTLNSSLPIPAFQHSFRKAHSTVTALNQFNHKVADGFNQKKPAKRTLLLQIDLSKAFDMVSHEKLLEDILHSPLPGYLKRWLNAYLHGRQSRVSFRGATSAARNVRTGVPQGAVTSPVLFNFYLTNLPPPPPGIEIVQYADDISVYTSGVDLDAMAKVINEYVPTLTKFLADRELQVSPEKSTVTLFTPSTHEFNYEPKVDIQSKPVKLERTPKLLGVKFDTMFTFSHHIKDTINKAKSRLNILKSLAGSAWGQDKETILLTYKSVCRSVLEYGVPIWSPLISPTNWEKLQRIQNQAMRIATGCLKATSIDHLHQETKILPLETHGTMLTKQFTAQSFHQLHPGNKFLHLPPPPRDMKRTNLVHEEDVSHLMQSDMSIKEAVQSIHTKTVSQSIATLRPNVVLKDKPPDIHPSELQLHRKVRSGLARLRSGFSRILRSYLHRLDESVPDTCPDCNAPDHVTEHLFSCPARPTSLCPRDLWDRPAEVASFLDLENKEEV